MKYKVIYVEVFHSILAVFTIEDNLQGFKYYFYFVISRSKDTFNKWK